MQTLAFSDYFTMSWIYLSKTIPQK